MSSVRTGATLRRLLPGTEPDGMGVTGLALDHAGDLWVTYSTGPSIAGPGGAVAPSTASTSGVAPVRQRCRNQVDVVHAGTGKVTVYLRTSGNVVISDAVPSPDGSLLVYREAACTAYFDDYLRVTALTAASGRPAGTSWTIGKGLPTCHVLSDVNWTAHGNSLLIGYSPADIADRPGGPGTCPMWWAGRLVRVRASGAQRLLPGRQLRADAGCSITAVADLAGGVLATEDCGGTEYDTGPVKLLVLNASLHIARRITLGNCGFGNEIAAARSGTAALITGMFHCQAGDRSHARLWRYRDGTLTEIHGVSSGVSLLAWDG